MDVWAFWTIGSFFRKTMVRDRIPDSLTNTILNDNTVHKVHMVSRKGYADIEHYAGETYPTEFHLDLIKVFSKTFIGTNKFTISAGTMMIDWVSRCSPSSVSVYGFDFKQTPTFSELNRFDEMKDGIDTRCHHNFNHEKYIVENILSKRISQFKIY
jgi:hypothetical protein